MKLSELYRLFPLDEPNSRRARNVLQQTHWFTVNAVFDPKTGEALPQPLSTFLSRVAQPVPDGSIHDRLWRITEHVRPSLERLFRAIDESPRRDHALMPVRAVRELDAVSFMKLSNRPGRTIREKLAGKPYLQAVRRYQSVDLSENRLLKAFVTRLAELLELRQDYLGEEEDELLPKIQSWLRSDEVQTIARWDNPPPNNTLLSHREYRRVWDAWCWLQRLDDDVARDYSLLEARDKTMRCWNEYARAYRAGTHLFADMPVLFSYEDFSIRSWDPEIKKVGLTTSRTINNVNIDKPVCIDLTYLRPHYACSAKSAHVLPENYLWQQWNDNNEHVDMDLFNSDAAYLHPDATTISSTDLFFSKDNTSENLDRAARAFAAQLRKGFINDTLIWLVPDTLDDFELEVIRRNINARFPYAEPLPRSVAAVFEQVEYARIRDDDYSVLVVDKVGGITCATILKAKFDANLKKRLPETNGYYWERCLRVKLSRLDTGEERQYGMVTVDGNGVWHNSPLTERPQLIDPRDLKEDARIGQFVDVINVTHSPVAGGMCLHDMQARANGIPLWRDKIPELSIRAYVNGFYRRFYLVGKNTPPVRPFRGKSVRLDIDAHFPLPVGEKYYSNPLYRGAGAEEIGFSLRLDSAAFPLKKAAVCELGLTFEYGVDEPYALIFSPLDKSFPPVRATWQRTVEEIVTDAPAPGYPDPMSWKDLHRFPDTKRGGTIDMIQAVVSTSSDLSRWMNSAKDDAYDKLQKNIRGWCRFLFFSIWRDGRSIADADCPAAFATATHSMLNTFQNAAEHGVSLFDVMVLMSSMHKDMPDECVQWIYEQVESGKLRDARSVGFALGDLSEMWQQYVFSVIVSRPTMAIDVLAYAIWREQNCLKRLALTELGKVLDALLDRLETLQPYQRKDGTLAISITPLELLLGLLRTRASDDPDIRMLLQPHQKITKQFAEQVNRIEEMIAETDVTLCSRVQINIQKSEGVLTPDLLYALRLYLTNGDGANAIHITGISDADDD